MPNIQIGKFHYTIPNSSIDDVMAQTIEDNVKTVFKTLKQGIDEISTLIRSNSKEHLYIFDTDGKVLYKIDGGRYSSITPNEVDANSAGKISLHNHGMNASFSDGDIHAACETNLKKIHLVNRRYRYSMERSNGENFDLSVWNHIQPLYKKSYAEAEKELKRVDSTTYTELLDHLTWKKVCSDKSNDLIYTADQTTNGVDYFPFFRTVK